MIAVERRKVIALGESNSVARENIIKHGMRVLRGTTRRLNREVWRSIRHRVTVVMPDNSEKQVWQPTFPEFQKARAAVKGTPRATVHV